MRRKPHYTANYSNINIGILPRRLKKDQHGKQVGKSH